MGAAGEEKGNLSLMTQRTSKPCESGSKILRGILMIEMELDFNLHWREE